MKHKILWLIVVILLGLFVFAKANPTNPTVVKINNLMGRHQELILTGATDTGETLPTDLTGTATVPVQEDQNAVVCTMDYTPVCAEVQVQCIKAPCPPIKETFGNRCMMNANTSAKFLYEGECDKSLPTIDLSNCKTYFDGCNTCSVENGAITGCTKKNCTHPDKPKCLENI